MSKEDLPPGLHHDRLSQAKYSVGLVFIAFDQKLVVNLSDQPGRGVDFS